MALLGGDAEDNTGLAGVLFTSLQTQFGPFKDTDLLSLYPFCNKLGEAIVAYFKANAEVKVVVPSTQGGLQTTTTVGVATDPPTSNQEITGTLT